MPTDKELSLARKLIAKQILAKNEMQQVLDELDRLRQKGEDTSLDKLLLASHLILPEELERLKKAKRVLHCNKCKALYNVGDDDIGTRFKCKQCGTTVMVPRPGQTQAISMQELKAAISKQENKPVLLRSTETEEKPVSITELWQQLTPINEKAEPVPTPTIHALPEPAPVVLPEPLPVPSVEQTPLVASQPDDSMPQPLVTILAEEPSAVANVAEPVSPVAAVPPASEATTAAAALPGPASSLPDNSEDAESEVILIAPAETETASEQVIVAPDAGITIAPAETAPEQVIVAPDAGITIAPAETASEQVIVAPDAGIDLLSPANDERSAEDISLALPPDLLSTESESSTVLPVLENVLTEGVVASNVPELALKVPQASTEATIVLGIELDEDEEKTEFFPPPSLLQDAGGAAPTMPQTPIEVAPPVAEKFASDIMLRLLSLALRDTTLHDDPNWWSDDGKEGDKQEDGQAPVNYLTPVEEAALKQWTGDQQQKDRQ